MLNQIKEITKSNNSFFGSPKMTMALNAQRKVIVPIIYRRTVSVLTTLRQAKAGSIKNIITNQQHPKKEQKIHLNVILTLTSPNKNGVPISPKKRLLDLNKKYFFAQSLTFMIDIQSAML